MRHSPPCMHWAEKLALRHEDLSPTDREALDAHLQSCETCKAAQDDYHYLDARLKALPLPTLKPFPRLPAQFFSEEGDLPPVSNPVRRPRNGDANRGMKRGKVRSFVERALAVGIVAALILAAFVFFNPQSPLNTQVITYKEHSDSVMALAWSRDQRRIASASWDGTVRIWNAQTGGTVLKYSEHSDRVCALAWSPDGNYIASGGWDKKVRVWDARSGRTIYIFNEHSNRVCALAWSPDGSLIASGDQGESTVQIWQVGSSKPRNIYHVDDLVKAVAWSRDGKHIAIASSGYVVVADITSKAPPIKYPVHKISVLTLAWSPDGKYIVSGGTDRKLIVWDSISGQIIFEKEEQGVVNTTSWSPDGRYIAAGVENEIQIYDANSGELLSTYKGYASKIETLAWSPLDGKHIASGGDDATVQIWSPDEEGLFLTP